MRSSRLGQRKRRPRRLPPSPQSGARDSTGEGRARPRRPASPLPLRGVLEAQQPGPRRTGRSSRRRTATRQRAGLAGPGNAIGGPTSG
jgi:hypothetical protein